jgi:hypothetical protein
VLIAAVVVVPVGFEVARARELGVSWQGRYTLPLAVGIPILGAVTLARRAALPPAIRLSASRAIVGALTIAHVVAYWQFLRRYSVGTNGPVLFFTHPHWQPPLPLALLLVGYLAALGAFAWTVGVFSRAGEPSRPAARSVGTTNSLSSDAHSG